MWFMSRRTGIGPAKGMGGGDESCSPGQRASRWSGTWLSPTGRPPVRQAGAGGTAVVRRSSAACRDIGCAMFLDRAAFPPRGNVSQGYPWKESGDIGGRSRRKCPAERAEIGRRGWRRCFIRFVGLGFGRWRALNQRSQHESMSSLSAGSETIRVSANNVEMNEADGMSATASRGGFEILPDPFQAGCRKICGDAGYNFFPP